MHLEDGVTEGGSEDFCTTPKYQVGLLLLKEIRHLHGCPLNFEGRMIAKKLITFSSITIAIKKLNPVA